MTRHLVIGYGEVGKALYEVLNKRPNHQADAMDVTLATPPITPGRYDAFHACFPFHDYQQFRAGIAQAREVFGYVSGIVALVVHATVPIGTTARLARGLDWPLAVHSPVRGVHPQLAEGLRTFPKIVGGPGDALVARWFEECGLSTRLCKDAETAEATKLWDTAQYGWQIVLAKEIARWCRDHGVDFDEVYRLANIEYNVGYATLGRRDVARPALRDIPGPIGGHCVMANLRLLGDNTITEIVRAANAGYAAETVKA